MSARAQAGVSAAQFSVLAQPGQMQALAPQGTADTLAVVRLLRTRMAQKHTWFAAGTDAKMVVAWLREAGAVASNAELPESDFPVAGREFILHFPSVGPLEWSRGLNHPASQYAVQVGSSRCIYGWSTFRVARAHKTIEFTGEN
jgi:hypothetical protein